MATLLFWIVLLFPLLEVLVITRVGARIGFWDTLFLLIAAAAIGSYLAQLQGKAALQRIQKCLQEGRVPDNEMIDGVLIFIGGMLFVFPGFISDVLGLFLIFPPTRWLARMVFLGSVRDRISGRNKSGAQGPGQERSERPLGRDGAEDAEIID